MTKGAPKPCVQTTTFTGVECLNLNANVYARRCRRFSPEACWKNAHTYKPIVYNKRALGINFSDSVCWHIILYEKLSVKRTEFYAKKNTRNGALSRSLYYGFVNVSSRASARARREYIRTFTFSRDYDIGRRPRVLSRRREISVAAASGSGGGGIRVEKCISPGGKVELLALIGEFVFTIGLGFSDGVEGLEDLSLYVDHIYILLHIIIYFLRANTRDLYAYISRSNKKWN